MIDILILVVVNMPDFFLSCFHYACADVNASVQEAFNVPFSWLWCYSYRL